MWTRPTTRCTAGRRGVFFHGYYDCYCYLPLYVTCGPPLLCGRLRRSNRDVADGAVEELQRIVGQIRQRWPRVRVVVRGDAGFCRDELMAWCKAAEGVDYVFGLERGRIGTQPLYEQLYCARGDMENRIKEQQLDLFADRDFGGDAAGEPVAAVLGPVRGGAAGGVATTRTGGDGAGAVAGGDAGIACGPAGETAGTPRAAASGRCVHPAPIRRAGRAECPGTGPG